MSSFTLHCNVLLMRSCYCRPTRRQHLVELSATVRFPVTRRVIPTTTAFSGIPRQNYSYGHSRSYSSGSGGTSGSTSGLVRRRKRVKYEQFNDAQLNAMTLGGTATAGTLGSGLESPFEYSGDTLDEYKQKANLSPWTPVPDSVARKIFDTAQPGPEDFHVELGSGDGRVNFTAIEYGVGGSIGIDVDEGIVKVATDRLKRIHPQPNIQFVVSDLLDPDSPAWNVHLPQATIITMYFAKDGLERIRPYLEHTLRGKRCKVFTCGYAMPGWESHMVETVLDMPIHFYDWGNTDDTMMIQSDSFVDALPSSMTRTNKAVEMDQYMKRKNIKSTFRPDPLPGFHPDDLIDYGWDDFGSNDNKHDDDKSIPTNSPRSSSGDDKSATTTSTRSACSKGRK